MPAHHVLGRERKEMEREKKEKESYFAVHMWTSVLDRRLDFLYRKTARPASGRKKNMNPIIPILLNFLFIPACFVIVKNALILRHPFGKKPFAIFDPPRRLPPAAGLKPLLITARMDYHATDDPGLLAGSGLYPEPAKRRYEHV